MALALNWNDVLSAIQEADVPEKLNEIHNRLGDLFLDDAMNRENMGSFYGELGQIHDNIIRKALSLAEKAVIKEAYGIAPDSYCWMITGSGGRGEQTLWTDQDNGLVYDCSPYQNKNEVEKFVKRLAEIGVAYLNQAGYPLCPGNVMATNKRWCQPVNKWKRMLSSWVETRSVNDLQFFLIASDFRVIFGNDMLGKEVKDWLIKSIEQDQELWFALADFIGGHEIPMGMFQQIFTERWGPYTGKFDLKYGIYVHLVNIVRLWSLAAGIKEVSTIERIQQLGQQSIWNSSEVKNMQTAFENVCSLRLTHSVTRERKNNPFDYHMNLHELRKEEVDQLKKSLKTAKAFQRKTKRAVLSRRRFQ